MSNQEQRTPDELTETLTLQGSLNVADSTVFDHSDMKIIALKVLAHEYRKLRLERDRLQNIVETLEIGS